MRVVAGRLVRSAAGQGIEIGNRWHHPVMAPGAGGDTVEQLAGGAEDGFVLAQAGAGEFGPAETDADLDFRRPVGATNLTTFEQLSKDDCISDFVSEMVTINDDLILAWHENLQQFAEPSDV